MEPGNNPAVCPDVAGNDLSEAARQRALEQIARKVVGPAAVCEQVAETPLAPNHPY